MCARLGGRRGNSDTSSFQSTPGPGDYEASLPSSPTLGSKGFGLRREGPTTSALGPGSYNIHGLEQHVQSSVGFGAGPVHLPPRTVQPAKGLHGPGPGTHTPKEPQQHVKGGDFGRCRTPKPGGGSIGERTAATTSAPGPGHYEVSPVSSPRLGSKGFGSRSEGSLDAVPGPGSYDTQTNGQHIQISVGFGAGPMHLPPRIVQPAKGLGSPGPGTHTVQEPQQRTKGGCFGGRQTPSIRSTPGPGDYEAPTSASPALGSKGFGSGREESRGGLTKTLPGPGSYDAKGSEQHVQSSIGFGAGPVHVPPKVAQPAKGLDAPGPGTHSPQEPQHRVKGGGFGARHTHSMRRHPGPGDYEVQRPCSPALGSKGFGTGREGTDQGFTNTALGPGSYNTQGLEQHVQTTIRFGAGPMHVPPKISQPAKGLDGPGPGKYSPQEVQGHVRGGKFGGMDIAAPRAALQNGRSTRRLNLSPSTLQSAKGISDGERTMDDR